MRDDLHRYLISRREYNDLNAQARRLGHSWDEISKLHRWAHDMARVTGSHVDAFEVLLRVAKPKHPMPPFIPNAKGNTMLSNLLFRLQQLISRWLYRGYKRRHKQREPEYFTPRFKNLEGQDD